VKRALFVLAAAALAGSVPARGHHSFAAHYHEDQSVTIEGEVLDFQFRNPHAWVYVLAPDEGGQTRQYGAEWGSPSRLNHQGITKETIRRGDRLIVSGSPGRNPSEYTIHMKRVERPADGWRWPRSRS
jgi:hypothetical protein